MLIVHPGTPEPKKGVPDETFFNHPGSDIDLRSYDSDSHDFPLPKLYIFICSPALGNLIPSVLTTSIFSNGDGPEPLPADQLPESRATLYNLLTFIFPFDLILPPPRRK
jgi:hypothetical protein